ncbi:hypothetical protein N0V88_000218 [Collariella sp. IMI 366227]|nr:hypothetical protein N0V88_000218 [Collariella sp. IMI 366227]
MTTPRPSIRLNKIYGPTSQATGGTQSKDNLHERLVDAWIENSGDPDYLAVLPPTTPVLRGLFDVHTVMMYGIRPSPETERQPVQDDEARAPLFRFASGVERPVDDEVPVNTETLADAGSLGQESHNVLDSESGSDFDVGLYRYDSAFQLPLCGDLLGTPQYSNPTWGSQANKLLGQVIPCDDVELDAEDCRELIRIWKQAIADLQEENPRWINQWLSSYGLEGLKLLSDTQYAALVGDKIEDATAISRLHALFVRLHPARVRMNWNPGRRLTFSGQCRRRAQAALGPSPLRQVHTPEEVLSADNQSSPTFANPPPHTISAQDLLTPPASIRITAVARDGDPVSPPPSLLSVGLVRSPEQDIDGLTSVEEPYSDDAPSFGEPFEDELSDDEPAEPTKFEEAPTNSISSSARVACGMASTAVARVFGEYDNDDYQREKGQMQKEVRALSTQSVPRSFPCPNSEAMTTQAVNRKRQNEEEESHPAAKKSRLDAPNISPESNHSATSSPGNKRKREENADLRPPKPPRLDSDHQPKDDDPSSLSLAQMDGPCDDSLPHTKTAKCAATAPSGEVATADEEAFAEEEPHAEVASFEVHIPEER